MELKEQVSNPPNTSPPYPKRSDTPSPQKHQPSKTKITKGSKKRSRDDQSNGRQYKVRIIEKPLVFPRASVTLVPTAAVTTATTTPPTISNLVIAITHDPPLYLHQQIYLSTDLDQSPTMKEILPCQS